jgi:cation-transporting ATPase 13A3/4/5
MCNRVHTFPQHGSDGNLANSPSAVSLDTVESGTVSPATDDSGYCFVMTGKTWMIAKTHFPDTVSRLVTRGAVFARMSPDHKQQLVQELQALGYYVGE